MPDLFGKKQLGRASTGGRFYATPSERVEANAIYFPDADGLLFGVAEYTVEAGNLGAFATEGTFIFKKPDDWIDNVGRKVFFRPSTGEIVNADKKGDVLIGFQVLANVPNDKLGVLLTSGEFSVVIYVTSTADSGAGSLRQAIADAQDGDVILFDSDVFPAGQTTSILLSSYITVNKSVSIYGGFNDGNGGYTSGATKRYYVYREIDGVKTKVYIDDDNPSQEGETVLFENVCRVALDGQEATEITRSSTNPFVTFAGIEYINGQWTNGGAVYNYGTSQTTWADCQFSDCVATSSGGAVRSESNAVCLFDDCVFYNCSATTGGGAVYSTSTAQNTLNDCVFDSCSTTNNGGCLYSTSTAQNTLIDCTISGCSATNNGGGLYFASSSQNTLNGCTITDCSATNGGGVYSSSTSQNTLNDCTISGCSANNGGGLHSTNTSQNTINDCVFESCTATNNGGAIFGYSTSQNTLNDCVFSGCESTSNGGAIYNESTAATVLNNCTLKNNMNPDTTKRGAVFVAGSVLELASTVFDALRIVGNVTATITDGIIRVDTLTTGATVGASPSFIFNDGAALTLTGTATIASGTTFTSSGRGYLATAAGIDISSATLTNVVACSYGAGLETFQIDADGATWTAQDLTTPILLEEKGDGATWTTLSDDATGGSYSDSFEIGTTLRAFDGVRFFVASIDAYWQVEPFVVASNGGGGAGDVSPSWTISDATITPNVEEV